MSNLIIKRDSRGQLVDDMGNSMNQLIDVVDNFQSSLSSGVTILVDEPSYILVD